MYGKALVMIDEIILNKRTPPQEPWGFPDSRAGTQHWGGGAASQCPPAPLPPSTPCPAPLIRPAGWPGGEARARGRVQGAHRHVGGFFSILQRDRQTDRQMSFRSCWLTEQSANLHGYFRKWHTYAILEVALKKKQKPVHVLDRRNQRI